MGRARPTTRVRDSREEPGSLKAMWPSGPMPAKKSSMPPKDDMDASYWAHSASRSGALPRRDRSGCCMGRCSRAALTVENVDVLRINVDVSKEVGPHKRVIALGMRSRETGVFVHVKRHNVLEGDRPRPVQCDQVLVRRDRRRPRRETYSYESRESESPPSLSPRSSRLRPSEERERGGERARVCVCVTRVPSRTHRGQRVASQTD